MAFKKMAVALTLLALVAGAFAVDADVQKRDHRKDHSKQRVRVTLGETVGTTFPTDPAQETLGSTVAQNAALTLEGTTVGQATWSGIVVQAAPSATVINYQVVLTLTGMERAGSIICGAASESIFSTNPVTLAVLGGTGAFADADGSVTWSSTNNVGSYALDVFVPKRDHKRDE